MNARVVWSNKGPFVIHEHKGVEASMRLTYHWLPERLRKFAVTFLRISRLNKRIQQRSIRFLIELTAHEWGHAYREKKLGFWNHAWTYVTQSGKLERETDTFDEAFQAEFQDAVLEIARAGFFGEQAKRLANAAPWTQPLRAA